MISKIIVLEILFFSRNTHLTKFNGLQCCSLVFNFSKSVLEVLLLNNFLASRSNRSIQFHIHGADKCYCHCRFEHINYFMQSFIMQRSSIFISKESISCEIQRKLLISLHITGVDMRRDLRLQYDDKIKRKHQSKVLQLITSQSLDLVKDIEYRSKRDLNSSLVDQIWWCMCN